jgi:methylmalonyl-CoA mutase cobalamin-binding domain/chain
MVGGIIPPRDVERLQALGVSRVFPMGTPLPEIVAAFQPQEGEGEPSKGAPPNNQKASER